VTARRPSAFVFLGFGSTHDALAAEAVLRDMGVPVVPVPAPRQLGSLCGIALRVPPADADRAENLLVEASMAPTGRAVIDDV
jgi:hypothetical protein